MTTAQVVETSVTVDNNSPIQDYLHPDDQTQPTFKMDILCSIDPFADCVTILEKDSLSKLFIVIFRMFEGFIVL